MGPPSNRFATAKGPPCIFKLFPMATSPVSSVSLLSSPLHIDCVFMLGGGRHSNHQSLGEAEPPLDRNFPQRQSAHKAGGTRMRLCRSLLESPPRHPTCLCRTTCAFDVLLNCRRSVIPQHGG